MEKRDRDSTIGGAWERTKGKFKRVAGDVANKPGLMREGQRQERSGEIESESARLARERDELRTENLRERKRDL